MSSGEPSLGLVKGKGTRVRPACSALPLLLVAASHSAAVSPAMRATYIEKRLGSA